MVSDKVVLLLIFSVCVVVLMVPSVNVSVGFVFLEYVDLRVS